MIQRRLVTAAVKQLLATVTSKPVGVMTAPIDPATGRPYPPPYTLLYPLDHDTDDQTLGDQHVTAVTSYQATFVSGPDPQAGPDSRGTDEQVEWLTDKGRAVVTRAANGTSGYLHPLTIPGAVCYCREANEVGATSDPNDAIITYVIRFRFYLDSTA